jgi:hypothetical protein
MCRRPVVALIVALALAASSGAYAGQTGQPQAQNPQARAVPESPAPPSLGISLDRIRRQLREVPPTRTSSPLKLEYHIEVVGRAPAIDFFSTFSIDKLTAVQYGGMTHAEFLRVTVPPWRR